MNDNNHVNVMNGRLDLSNHDREVLGRIFSPHLPDADPDSAEDRQQQEPSNFVEDEIENELLRTAKKLEREAVLAANARDLVNAERLLSEAIQASPGRASVFNNRAQVRQLANDITGAELDLEEALSHSNGHGVAARQAFTQRAILRRLRGDDEGALDDFKRAVDLGGQFAKSQVIAMNPYAAMCSAMMTEMMAKIRRGEMDG